MSSHTQSNALQFIPPTPQEIGSLLTAYDFDSLLAKGGMGAVYHATQRSLDRPVAIKILPREFGDDVSFRTSFETEAKIMARLNHPNLISIFDFGDIDGMLFIAMEFVAGKSLHDNAHGRKIAPAKAADVVLGICDGLEHAHHGGILHRDIKPANIFITPEGKPKIGDFGLARPSGNTETGVIYGTPGYTAPEVLHSPEKVGAHTDVYSVGVILYELLAGQLPSDLYEPVTNYCKCDPGFDLIIRRALNPVPANRYQSAQQMADEIKKLLQKIKDNDGKPQPALRTLATPSQALSPTVPNLKIGSAPIKGQTGRINPLNTGTVSIPIKQNNGNSIRNIVIIGALLALIYFVYGQLQQKKARMQQAQEEVEISDATPVKPVIATKPITPTTQEPKTPTTQPDSNVSAYDAIVNIKGSLLNGERPLSKMPSKAFQLSDNSRTLAYVDKPMTWFEANAWCQNHGGHLAISKSQGDINTLREHIPTGKSAWLGAGTTSTQSWAWVDGSPLNEDTLKIRTTAELSFALVDDYMIAKPMPGNHRSGFFIEWRMDGSNPANLERILSATAKTLHNIKPEFPAGTVTFGSRHYTFILKPLTYDQAKRLALIAGATIATPSDRAEQEFIHSLLRKNLPPDALCRNGGILNNDKLKGNPSIVAVNSPYPHWQSISPETPVPYTLLEWSKDQANAQTEQIEQDNDSKLLPLGELKKLAQDLTTKVVSDHQNLRKKTNLSLIGELEFLHDRKLTNSQRNEYGEDIMDVIYALKKKDYIPSKLEYDYLPDHIIKLIQSSKTKQENAEMDYAQKISKIRVHYASRLTALINHHKSQNQLNLARQAEQELDAIGRTNKSFLKHFD